MDMEEADVLCVKGQECPRGNILKRNSEANVGLADAPYLLLFKKKKKICLHST